MNLTFLTKKQIYSFLVFSYVFFFTSLLCAQSTSCGSHTLREEYKHTIGEHVFVHTLTVVDGEIDEYWSVDSKDVDQGAYTNSMLEAERVELEHQAEKERERSQERVRELNQMQCQAFKKLIEKYIQQLEEEIARIRDYDLLEHLLWSDDTISSRTDYDALSYELIPRVQKLCVQQNLEKNLLEKSVYQLEDSVDRVRKLFKKTVEHVIAHTSDMKLLKKLVNLV